MNIAVFGGSFNPIHFGHLIAAQEILWSGMAEEVWFMPCYKNPLKQNGMTDTAKDRLEMVSLSIEGNPKLRVSELELKRKGESYTIETIRELKKSFPEHGFHWVMGSDLVEEFHKWKEAKEIVKEVKIIVFPLPDFKEINNELIKNSEPLIVNTPITTNISSSLIRERVKRNKPVDYLITRKVQTYLQEHELYK
ncbi:MAG: nicotinate (nicotinamide) nucleotide adenylyltransferase [archaeon]|nr:nicotinate (nicotinamide) nucleotide adenylyltransferase [Candidatus Micrarchaeota archaeon]